MIITIIIVSSVLIILMLGRLISYFKFIDQVKTLFLKSKILSNKIYQKSQLDNLPEPVRKYFNLVLKEKQSYINYVRMTHSGQFKTGLDKDWINITGEQYVTTERPGFIWKGITTFFTARDMYIEDRGRLTVSLFSIFNIKNETGVSYDQGELLRWLGESVLYPTNFLPSEKLKWIPIDGKTAKLIYNYKGISLFFIIIFNEIGEITQMESKRYMSETKLETWCIKFADYKEINSIVVPTYFEVLWKLKRREFCYAKFNLLKIGYNKPIRF